MPIRTFPDRLEHAALTAIGGRRIVNRDSGARIYLGSDFLSKEVSLLQGGVALALLIAPQFAVTWSSVRLSWVNNLVNR